MQKIYAMLMAVALCAVMAGLSFAQGAPSPVQSNSMVSSTSDAKMHKAAKVKKFKKTVEKTHKTKKTTKNHDKKEEKASL